MDFIDITVPMRPGMLHHPAVPPFECEDVFRMDKGDGANLKRLCFGSHIGTHFDPPYHQINDGKKGEDIPANFFIGKAKVFSFLSGENITLEEVRGLDIDEDDMVLLKTPNSKYMLGDDFIEDYVTITLDAAEFLVNKGIRAIGFDYLSPDEYGSNDPAHKIILGAGVPIIEGLYLGDVEPGTYKMTALFLSIKNSDGGPIRAILEK